MRDEVPEGKVKKPTPSSFDMNWEEAG